VAVVRLGHAARAILQLHGIRLAKAVKVEDAMSEVRCVDCGLLALRGTQVDEIFEANLEFRETGKATSPQGKWIYQPTPLCFARAVDLHKKLKEKGYPEIIGAITQAIDCNSFVPWMQGYSPKEHADMELQRQILELHRKREDADRDWRERQAEREHGWREQSVRDDKAWREQQAKDERGWREQQAKSEDRRHIINLIVYGLLAIAAGIVGAAIQANWIQKPDILNAGDTTPQASANTR
jgi:hypothetical protein